MCSLFALFLLSVLFVVVYGNFKSINITFRYRELILIRDFFLGFIKIHILYHASKKPIYGVGIMEEIKSRGYDVGPSLIYPALNSLKARGLLECSKRVVNGKFRKYYKITENDHELLEESMRKIAELVGGYLSDNTQKRRF